MLVITRREGEEIVIGDPKNPLGVVRIASIVGERVRVGLEFPKDVPIHRREIADKIVAEPTPREQFERARGLDEIGQVLAKFRPVRVRPPQTA